MNLDRFFRIISYTAVFGGFLSLWVSGTFGIVSTGLYIGVMIGAWFLEGSRWQISERLGTVLIVLSLPIFYFGWRYQVFGFTSSETMVGGILARLILTLTAVKLLQKKGDRDWIFLYLMSFFEVLLAAGLSISALYLASFVIYLLVMVCAIIAFEIKKTSKAVGEKIRTAKAVTLTSAKAVTFTATVLLVLIVLLGLPLFFMLPRVGGAGLGSNQSDYLTSTGFSDTVRLGGIGRIQQSDKVVMRVRVDDEKGGGNFYWRGIALDTFNNQSWSKSKPIAREPHIKGDLDFIQVDFATSRNELVTQTVYLEPLDTPVLFALAKPVLIQSNFPTLYKDSYGAISFVRGSERISYKVLSDRSLPGIERLRADNTAYPADFKNYLQLPVELDQRIVPEAEKIAGEFSNRYDKAKAIESHLQNNFGYTLELKAGGEQPLADFLFNVREGHCEYFATAMAVMLRTQGVAARVVNGFQQGDYNDAADVYVVKQQNAHSWVEVYFPKENVWVQFDPTPFAGRSNANSAIGFTAQVSKYLEALETFWIQYFVAYDTQEQASLMRSIRKEFTEYQTKTSSWVSALGKEIAQWWNKVRGDEGLQASLIAIGYAVGYLIAASLVVLLMMLLYRKASKLLIWQRLYDWLKKKKQPTVIEFYDRMQRILASKGFRREPHQTPLEFAFAMGAPEAVDITKKYNRVRFGEKKLSREENRDIEDWLRNISTTEAQRP